MPWFAVRTLLHTRPVGRPRSRDASYRAVAAVEERIVLLRARSAVEAVRLGAAEAKAYTQRSILNVYGQRVVSTLLPHVESYSLDARPGHGSEVFSSIEQIDPAESRHRIVRRKIGEAPHGPAARMFLAGWIARTLMPASPAAPGKRQAGTPRRRRGSKP
jgi:hypothetical protein